MKAKNPAERATYDANYRCEDNAAVTGQLLVELNEGERDVCSNNLRDFTKALDLQIAGDEPKSHNSHTRFVFYENTTDHGFPIGWNDSSEDY